MDRNRASEYPREREPHPLTEPGLYDAAVEAAMAARTAARTAGVAKKNEELRMRRAARKVFTDAGVSGEVASHFALCIHLDSLYW